MARSARAPRVPGVHLRTIDLDDRAAERGGHPFDLPLVRQWSAIELTTPVTFLVGENATGKSTFLEALAVAAGSIVVGQSDAARDPTLATARALASHMRLAWRVRTRKGFFLRAEDFFAYVKGLHALRSELQSMADDFGRGLDGYGRQLAVGAALGQAAELERRYDGDLDARSHGESFLALFQARFRPGGLHLLDEPEAALSPTSQLALLAMLQDCVEADGQFVIATHSPIVMASPGGRILSFDRHPVAEVPYAEVAHVQLWRDFMRYPELFLGRLL